jgi:hypothetical protein
MTITTAVPVPRSRAASRAAAVAGIRVREEIVVTHASSARRRCPGCVSCMLRDQKIIGHMGGPKVPGDSLGRPAISIYSPMARTHSYSVAFADTEAICVRGHNGGYGRLLVEAAHNGYVRIATAGGGCSTQVCTAPRVGTCVKSRTARGIVAPGLGIALTATTGGGEYRRLGSILWDEDTQWQEHDDEPSTVCSAVAVRCIVLWFHRSRGHEARLAWPRLQVTGVEWLWDWKEFVSQLRPGDIDLICAGPHKTSVGIVGCSLQWTEAYDHCRQVACSSTAVAAICFQWYLVVELSDGSCASLHPAWSSVNV